MGVPVKHVNRYSHNYLLGNFQGEKKPTRWWVFCIHVTEPGLSRVPGERFVASSTHNSVSFAHVPAFWANSHYLCVLRWPVVGKLKGARNWNGYLGS
jgi:hypothetical protein